MDLAYECENRYSEDYDDRDDSGDTEYQYSDLDVELEEEDVPVPNSNPNLNNTPFSSVLDYFLVKLHQL